MTDNNDKPTTPEELAFLAWERGEEAPADAFEGAEAQAQAQARRDRDVMLGALRDLDAGAEPPSDWKERVRASLDAAEQENVPRGSPRSRR